MAKDEEKSPIERPIEWLSQWQASFVRTRQRFGLLIAVLLALLVAGGFIWWNWEDIAKRPGIPWFVAQLERHSLPIAPPGRLTIAIAHLADDKEQQEENLILDGLRDFEGVETLAIDRVVEWPAAGTEREKRKEAEEQARSLLKKSGADVLIWGSVISLNGKSAMRLYWTPSREIKGAKESERYQSQTETIALPAEFWSDLKQILGLLTQSRFAELNFGEEEHYVADKLAPLIVQVRRLVQSKEGVWEPETLAGVQFSLAVALKKLGEQSGRDEPLVESVELYRKVLDEWTRERAPLQRATAENNLGNALLRLGEGERSAATLQQAVTAYLEALKERTRERVPLDWAQTQNNLGYALLRLGERESSRESSTEKLEEAIIAFREAQKEYTRERVPLDWAQTQNNLGSALARLGEHESDTEKLQEAVAAFREALEVLALERVPLYWAGTQNNLGTALTTLGERERGTASLQQAVTAYHEALMVYTRERFPLKWAATQNNLGNALLRLGEREGGTGKIEEAVSAFHAALEESAPYLHDFAQQNLERANALLAERRGGIGP